MTICTHDSLAGGVFLVMSNLQLEKLPLVKEV